MPPRAWILGLGVFVLALTTLDVLQLAFQYGLQGRDPATATRLFGWGLAEWSVRSLMIPAAVGVARRFPLDTPGARLRRGGVHALGSLLLGPLLLALSVPFVMPQFRTPPWSPGAPPPEMASGTLLFLLSRYLLPGVVIYWLIVGVYHLWRYELRYRDQLQASAALERRSLALESRLQEAKLHALKAQIRPHFLFNTLNAITVLARDGRSRAVVETTTFLADILRHSVDVEDQVGTVREELRLARRYLRIERLRFGSRLEASWRVARDCLDAELPTLSVQPLVENAVRHGLGESRRRTRVCVAACRRGDRLLVRVEDTGVGLGTPRRPIREGVGLGNTRERLRRLYGEAARLEVLPAARGVRVELEIPYRPRGGAGDTPGRSRAASTAGAG